MAHEMADSCGSVVHLEARDLISSEVHGRAWGCLRHLQWSFGRIMVEAGVAKGGVGLHEVAAICRSLMVYKAGILYIRYAFAVACRCSGP